MAKKRTRARSKVTIDLPERPLAYSDAIFVVRRAGRKIGELRISQGGVDWYSRNARYGKRLNWARFAALMDGS